MENKIIVLYIGVQGIRTEDIKDYVKKISKKIMPTTIQSEIIIIPTQSPNTRIECINPIYIIEEKLISEHTKMIKQLKLEIQHQLKQLKKENNE